MESLWIPSSSSALQAEKTVMEHESVNGGDDDLDGWCHSRSGKKRRLTATQVEFLERSFEVENKLEAERKLQLAKQVGLQPRQVAIWFQNRRARSKNKQLEKDYDSLKASFDKLKADFDNLLKEKQDLQNELLALKEKVLIGEEGIKNLGSLDEPQKPNSDTTSHVPLMACKEEEACSAKSDVVFESDTPHYIDGHGQEGYHSSFIEPADSSNVFESDKSDEEDNLISNPALFFPEFDCYYDARPTSCYFTLPVEDQSFWSSLY